MTIIIVEHKLIKGHQTLFNRDIALEVLKTGLISHFTFYVSLSSEDKT